MQQVLIPAKVLKDAVRFVGAHAAAHHSMALIRNICLEIDKKGVKLVATDGYRLVEYDITRHIPQEYKVKVGPPLPPSDPAIDPDSKPKKKEEPPTAPPVEEIDILANQPKYPNYHQIIPDSFKHEVVIDRDLLLAAVQYMPKLYRDGHCLKFQFVRKEDSATAATEPTREVLIRASDRDYAMLEFPLKLIENKLSEPSAEIHLNGKYLADALKTLPPGPVVFKMNSPTQSILLHAYEDESVRVMLMPIRS